jgi:ubiquinone/menaquinone biosynthesis C-methylase UbiE
MVRQKTSMDNELLKRQEIEKNYHDTKYKGDLIVGSGRGENRAYKFFQDLIGDVRGLIVLDFGCGTGWMSLALAKRGGGVYGIDISGELIKKALQLADREGLTDKIHFMEMPGENLTFQENYFDLVLGSSILHHTDIPMAMNGIARVLKPNGRAIFLEPMNQNIILKVWRKLTPRRRSPSERALSVNDLKLIQGFFPEAKFHFFTFSSIFSEGLLILYPTNKLLHFLNDLMERFDKMLLRAFPSLGKYSAVVVLDLRKDKGDSVFVPCAHQLDS